MTVVREWEPKIIGLAGRARVGKDTVAALLKMAYPCKSVAFADPIRGALGAMDLGLTHEHFHGALKEEIIDWLGVSYRHMAQTLGTDWGREMVNDNIWVLVAKRKIDQIHANGFHAIVTDVRFDNEAEFLRKHGGVIWHIKRANVQSVAAHKSEAGVTFVDGDAVIFNNGTKEDLFVQVCDEFRKENEYD